MTMGVESGGGGETRHPVDKSAGKSPISFRISVSF